MKKIVTVMTPTYNREHELCKLFESLKLQTSTNFSWLIIDDGSTDGTSELIASWLKEDLPFDITLLQKSNGGKHTALNLGFQAVLTELTFIVDSDDVLTPDAIQSIEYEWSKCRSIELSGISFLRGNTHNLIIGDAFPITERYNDIDMRCRRHVHGDKAEVWRTDILKKYQFPVFEGERFQGENYIWWQIALEYDMYYVNKIIYITEYLEGGLTRSGRTLRIKCPLGGMENSRMGLHKRFPLPERFKRAMLYVCYGKFAALRFHQIVSKSGYPLLISSAYIPGYLLYLYWKHKYL